VKYATTKVIKLVEKALLFIYESVYSKETLRAYFKDDDWFDDEYIESERRKKNEVAYNNKSKFQPYRCPSCNKPWRFYTMPKGKVPLREFLGNRVPMEEKKCPKELKCQKRKK
tara:strand:+ start:2352 stop:2690 length:339 start_codon:yes stop_codon:yes gene_type:complete